MIVEDELMARKSLANTLKRLYPDVTIAGETGSVTETLRWLGQPENRADVIFMDVELSDGTCFDIFSQTDIRANVIMTTAYDSYAVKAFEVESIDYLLKPVDEQALKRAMERCISRISKGVPGPRPEKGLLHDTAPRHAKERFLVKINDTIVPVKTDEIAWFYSEDKTTWLVTFKGRKYGPVKSAKILPDITQLHHFHAGYFEYNENREQTQDRIRPRKSCRDDGKPVTHRRFPPLARRPVVFLLSCA